MSDDMAGVFVYDPDNQTRPSALFDLSTLRDSDPHVLLVEAAAYVRDTAGHVSSSDPVYLSEVIGGLVGYVRMMGAWIEDHTASQCHKPPF